MSVAEQVERHTTGEPWEHSRRLFRAVNERIRELAEEWAGDCDFMCECHDESCTRVVRLTLAEYDSLRADGASFVVLHGHEHEHDEALGRGDNLVVVRQSSDAGAGSLAG